MTLKLKIQDPVTLKSEYFKSLNVGILRTSNITFLTINGSRPISNIVVKFAGKHKWPFLDVWVLYSELNKSGVL